MSVPFYFHFQVEGKESPWLLAHAHERDKVTAEQKPAFVTVLDYTGVPADNDWAKVKYRGPLYFDFDADGDIELVCEQLKVFLGRLYAEFSVEMESIRIYASGGKGFHVEIPAATFIGVAAEKGQAWLPYIYRFMAERLVVDTMDMAVYSAKRGRQWRTPGVQRENGNYKVQLSFEDALEIDPEKYAEHISEPRPALHVAPPQLNPGLQQLYTQAKETVQTKMRGKLKRLKDANVLLEPWKKAGKVPPSVARLMRGEDIAEGVGFQRLAMQLAIYASSVQMDLDAFLTACQGLIETHRGDGHRYRGADRRRAELARMWEYMGENELYDFERDPIVRMLVPGTPTADLGITSTVTESGEVVTMKSTPTSVAAATAADAAEEVDPQSDEALEQQYQHALEQMSRGAHSSRAGLLVPAKDGYEQVAAFRILGAHRLVDLDGGKQGDSGLIMVAQAGSRRMEIPLKSADLASEAALRRKLLSHGQVFRGDQSATSSVASMVIKMSERETPKYQVASEGLHYIEHPMGKKKGPKLGNLMVPVYVGFNTTNGTVSDSTASTLHVRQPQPGEASHYGLSPLDVRFSAARESAHYNANIHEALTLREFLSVNDVSLLKHIFKFSVIEVVAPMLAWFVACHYRQLYLRHFKQFPIMQIYGEAGAGKSQTVCLLAGLHWDGATVDLRSASGQSAYALDQMAAGSVSAPLLLDEYKPREMGKVKVEKLKDLAKNCYIGATIGQRGFLDKQTNEITLTSARANAPLAILSEGVEDETAIMERSIIVEMRKTYHNPTSTAAFYALADNSGLVSSIGRSLMEATFSMSMEGFKDGMIAWRTKVRDQLRPVGLADRPIYNLAVLCHSLDILQYVFQASQAGHMYDAEFDALREQLLRVDMQEETYASIVSEATKVLQTLSYLSQTRMERAPLQKDHDYYQDDTFLDLDMRACYVAYRVHCGRTSETALYDSYRAFQVGLQAHMSVVERRKHHSPIHTIREGVDVTRFSLELLANSGVTAFMNVNV